MKNTVKFEIEMKKSTLKKVRQFLIDNDWEGDSDEDVIQEVFFMFSLRGEVDVRNEVKLTLPRL